MKSKIRPEVRAKLEELGVDVVRSKLTPIMGVSGFAEQDKLEPLDEDGLSAHRREIQEWLKEKAASDRWWMKAAAIAAAVAAIISLLAWVFPRSASSGVGPGIAEALLRLELLSKQPHRDNDDNQHQAHVGNPEPRPKSH